MLHIETLRYLELSLLYLQSLYWNSTHRRLVHNRKIKII